MNALLALLHETWRSLRRRPLANLSVVLVLSMGLTAVVSVSSIAELVVQSNPIDLPADRLYAFGVGADVASSRSLAGKEALALRRDIPGLSGAALLRTTDFNLAAAHSVDGARAERVSGALVDGDPFALLGWTMAQGPGFRTADFAPGAANTVVIGELLWRSRFAADPAVIGRQIRVDGEAATVVGVLGPRRAYPFQQQLYRATSLASDGSLQGRWWQTMVRLDERSKADAVASAIAAQQLERERLLGDEAKREPLRFSPLWNITSSPQTYLLLVVLAVVVGLVMLMAASNAGGLLMVQWLSRDRELATRHALGASCTRVAGSLLGQGLALVAIAWCVAVALSALILDQFGAYLNTTDNGMPLYMSFRLSPSVLAICAATAIAAALLLTLPTWLRLSRGSMTNDLRSGARSTSGLLSRFGRVVFGLQSLLAVITVLATFQAAVGARDQQLRSLGLSTDAVLTAQVDSIDGAGALAFAQRLRERLAQEPNIAAVSIAAHLPIAFSSNRDVAIGDQRLSVDYAPVDNSFAKVYDVPLRSGAWFSTDDVTTERKVAVIDTTLAEALFPGADPIGRKLTLSQNASETVEFVIVGVTAVVRSTSATGPDNPTLFVPLSAQTSGPLAIAMRINGAPEAATARLLAIASDINPDFALTHVGSFAKRRAEATEWTMMVLGLFAPLGALALVLAATGLAALLGSLVNDRVREIGLRRALGATPARLVRGLLAGLARWGGAGAGIGLGCAALLVAPLSQSLYGERELGLTAVLMTFLALATVLLLAVAPPLRRALAVTPMVALRND